jgi:hypothetical protein
MAERIDSASFRACPVNRFTPAPENKPVVQVVVDGLDDTGMSASVQTNLGAEMSGQDARLAVGHLLHQLAHVFLGGEAIEPTPERAGGAA